MIKTNKNMVSKKNVKARVSLKKSIDPKSI
jgi:hypothetical protein